MTYLIGGGCLLLFGAAFFWLNNNSPVQTRIPLFTLPIGAAMFLIGLVKVLP